MYHSIFFIDEMTLYKYKMYKNDKNMCINYN